MLESGAVLFTSGQVGAVAVVTTDEQSKKGIGKTATNKSNPPVAFGHTAATCDRR